MMTSLEETCGDELIGIVESFALRFGSFRKVFVSAIWADLRAQHATMTTLLPRNAWTVAFLRTASTMFTLNEHLAQEMRQVAGRDVHSVELETILLHFAPLFSVYAQYYEAKKPFAELLRSQRAQAEGLESLIRDTEKHVGMSFDEILDMPLQQVIALRGCISKQVGRSAGDTDAVDHLRPIADFLESAQTRINDIEARHASEALLVQIAANWDVGNHIFAIKRPGRLIVKEGTLIKVSRKKEVLYQFVLFNDALIYGSRTGVMSRKQFKMHNALDLAAVSVGVVSVGDNVLKLDDFSTVASGGAVGGAVLSMLSSLSVQDQNALSFNVYSGDGGKSFCVKAKSPGELCDWWLALSRAVGRRKAACAAQTQVGVPSTKESASAEPSTPQREALSPVWQPDKASPECTLCGVPFTALRRRHHCYSCGRLLCGACSRFRGVRQVSALAKESPLRRMLKRQGSTGVSDRAQEKQTLERSVRMCESCSEKSLPLAVLALQDQHETAGVEHADTECTGAAPLQHENSGGQVADILLRSPPLGANLDGNVRVALDILQSEVSYLEGLRTLLEVYVRPLLDDFRSDARLIGGEAVGIVKHADLASMFVFLSDIQYIAALSERLVKTLRSQCLSVGADGVPSLHGSIAEVFLQMSSLFQLYDEYSSSFEFANRTLAEQTHALKTLRDFLDGQERAHRARLQNVGAQCMQSLLILPIQRLPRYILLLHRLQEHTDPQSAEFERLRRAVDAIQAMTQHINERIREREGLVKMHDLARCWGEVVLRDAPVDRRCIREGSLVKQSRKAEKKYDFVLFSDALIYGEREDFLQRVRHHRTLLVAYCEVRKAEDDPSAFDVVGREKSFRVRAESERLCRAWIEDLQRTIASMREHQRSIKSETAPVWVKDTTQCMRCSVSFSIIVRPHHCRRCGKCLCNDCTPNRWLLEHIDPHKPQRVCLDCFGALFATYGPPVLAHKNDQNFCATTPQDAPTPPNTRSPSLPKPYRSDHEGGQDEVEQKQKA